MLKSSLKILTSLTLALVIVGQSSSQDADKQIDITAELFKCLTDMARAGSGAFFVDNVLGDLDGTIAVANSETGGAYPPGSVVALVPTEAMVKHEEGWNPATNDWEFFELNVSDAGSEINVRGTTNVVNRFGGNCFDCHKLATPQWDLICGTDHGCAPLPIPRETIVNIQNTDPRCVRSDDAA